MTNIKPLSAKLTGWLILVTGLFMLAISAGLSAQGGAK